LGTGPACAADPDQPSRHALEAEKPIVKTLEKLVEMIDGIPKALRAWSPLSQRQRNHARRHR
jgi:hypothetical protein